MLFDGYMKIMSKITIEQVKQVCKEKGFECLDNEYINCITKLNLICKEGHNIKISFGHIQENIGCKICSNKKKSENFRLSLELVKQRCLEKGFTCLSNEYINNSIKLKLKCQHDHLFESNYSNIHSGNGCPVCAKNKDKINKLPLEYIKMLCEKRQVELLDNEYINESYPLRLKCKFNHEFKISYIQLKNNKETCSVCLQNKINELNAKRIMIFETKCKEKQLECLDNYLIARSKETLKFKCKNNHIFNSSKYEINRDDDCNICIHGEPLTIELLKKIALSKNGLCLSDHYVNRNTKLRFYCNNCKKDFWSTPSNIKINNSWCPNCCESRSEKLCRYYLETIFNKPFPKQRPLWLKNNKTNRYLELDGYNEELKLAFEHNGIMHYKLYRSTTQKEFDDVQYRDQIKLDICKQNNVKLIVIPELGKKVKLENLISYIKEQCLLQNIALPNNFDDIQINPNQIYF